MKTQQTPTLEALIEACKFDYINENIPKLFKTEPIRGELGVKSFGKYMTSEEVLADFKKEGLQPMNATELFKWTSENKDFGKDFGKDGWKYVVALGSEDAFDGERRVCFADFGGAERGAGLRWFGEGWYDGAFFGFYRESSAPEHSGSLPLDLTINGFTYRRV